MKFIQAPEILSGRVQQNSGQSNWGYPLFQIRSYFIQCKPDPKRFIPLSGCALSGAGPSNLPCQGSCCRWASRRNLGTTSIGSLLIGEFISKKIRSLEEMCVFPEMTLETLLPPMLDPGQDFALPIFPKKEKMLLPVELPYFTGNASPEAWTLSKGHYTS